MGKILVSRGKKEFIEDLGREMTVAKPRYYYVEDISKDFHAAEGIFSKKDISKKEGSAVKSSKGKEFAVFSSSFSDDFSRIKRIPQIIPLKDIGIIIAETGIGKESRVADSGTGSGALACFLAGICKEVFSYDIKKEHVDIAMENAKMLGLKNISIKCKSVYDGIDENNLDLFVLDVPEPWKAITTAEKCLKPGAWLVSYSPTVPQVMDFAADISSNENFIVNKTIEIIEREWDVDKRKVRPKSTGIGHSGFLTFARKIR